MREAIEILVRYQAFTGHEVAHLRSTVKAYHLLLKDLGRDESAIRDFINKLGLSVGLRYVCTGPLRPL
jgi:hypothetical protein